ncbi:MAG: menaquinone biosynthesis decarboxylase [Bacteroidota bacterium]|nr:menaquinone biosynthesis decarboxylase [Bacteroidota bacterium]
MAYKNLYQFISTLENAGELVRIREFVSPRLEITEVADRVMKTNGKALLFENTGTPFPLLINAFGSEKRMAMALGVNSLDEFDERMIKLLKEFVSSRDTFIEKLKVLPVLQEVASWLPKVVSGRGPCQEVVMDPPDLTKLPVLTCWPADGGPFITLPVVRTKDPENGIHNTGMYRMQVFGPLLTGMHWHLHKGSATHYRKYKLLKKRMPVAVTLGGDPSCTYVATAPLPENLDEFLFAGFLRKKKVELVRCLTQDLEVPADADFVIEGYIDPEEDLILEGPFGDHTGFYSLADYYPRFHVTCITHRKNAIYPATIVGIPPMEDGWIGKATEKIFRFPIQLTSAPELTGMHMPIEGVFHNLVIAGIKKTYPGEAFKTMNALWGAGQLMTNKVMILVTGDTSPEDYTGIARMVSQRVDPVNDIHFSAGPVDILDHSSRRFAFGSKMGIDATEKLPGEDSPDPGLPVDYFIDKEKISEMFPGISSVNDALLQNGISVVLFTIRKKEPGAIQEISRDLLRKKLIYGMKFIVFVDEGADIQCWKDVAWIVFNNIDPSRDCFYIKDGNGNRYPVLFVDGTRKEKGIDGFQREWPNIIVMDDATIRKINEIWPKLNLGNLIPSPSLKYKSLITSYNAIA